MYKTDAVGSVKDCYFGQVLGGGHIELPGVPTETYEY